MSPLWDYFFPSQVYLLNVTHTTPRCCSTSKFNTPFKLNLPIFNTSWVGLFYSSVLPCINVFNITCFARIYSISQKAVSLVHVSRQQKQASTCQPPIKVMLLSEGKLFFKSRVTNCICKCSEAHSKDHSYEEGGKQFDSCNAWALFQFPGITLVFHFLSTVRASK